MNHPVLVSVLLAAAILVIYAACLGLLLVRGAAARLHYLGPVTLLSPGLVSLAIIVQEGLSQAGRKAIFITCVLLLEGPILAHILGRAIHAISQQEQHTSHREGNSNSGKRE